MTMPDEMKELRERLSHEYSRGLSGVCQSDFSLGFNAAYAAMAGRERELREAIVVLRSWIKANADEIECRGDEDCDHCVGLSLLAQRKEGDERSPNDNAR